MWVKIWQNYPHYNLISNNINVQYLQKSLLEVELYWTENVFLGFQFFISLLLMALSFLFFSKLSNCPSKPMFLPILSGDCKLWQHGSWNCRLLFWGLQKYSSLDQNDCQHLPGPAKTMKSWHKCSAWSLKGVTDGASFRNTWIKYETLAA